MKAGFDFAIYFDNSWMYVEALHGAKVLSKEANATAVPCVLREARLRRIHKIHLLLDALDVVRVINGALDWSIHHILPHIKDVSSNFDEIIFSHIPRRLNDFAHDLAKDSFEKGICHALETGC